MSRNRADWGAHEPEACRMSQSMQPLEDPLESMSRELSGMVDEMARRSFYHFSQSLAWQPAVNVYEDDASLYFCVELAGLHKEQVQVEVAENRVTVRGERAVQLPPDCPAGVSMLRLEINSGPFERVIKLPALADADTTQARLIDGFLWIEMRKRNT